MGRLPVKTRQLIKSPLRDDFAVLKIDPVPEGLTPLPIDADLDPITIGKLSPVITLGFPLGSQTQGTEVNVSVTRGHVRRSFENLFQVDTSSHRGNSGGPLIDVRGKVIGIASRVAMGWAAGPVPVATHLPDIGMVLPINKAAELLRELKAGRAKWNGILDLSMNEKVKEIVRLAGKSKWREAGAMADRELKKSVDPRLILVGAMMHVCREDDTRAGELFSRSLSMDPTNDYARWMLFVIDWRRGRSEGSIHGSRLLAMDWRAPAEFLGHLARILLGRVDEKTALEGGYTSKERSWIRKLEAEARLERFIQRVEAPWYKEIARCLKGEIAEEFLLEKAGACPEYLVTAHMALGLRAEGFGRWETALKHYKEALGSYMDDWFEYEFAMERIRRLKDRDEG